MREHNQDKEENGFEDISLYYILGFYCPFTIREGLQLQELPGLEHWLVQR